MAVQNFYFFGSYNAFKPFIMEVESDNNGEFTIPTFGTGYNYNVKTSDGQNFTGQTGNLTITFPSANTHYDIEISGLFPQIYFNNGSERLKIKDIKQWGDIVWGANQSNAFWGCADMTCSALDSPDFTLMTNGTNMFYGATSFNPPNFAPTLENLTIGTNMFREATSFAQEIYAPNSIQLLNDNSMFRLSNNVEKITLNNTALTTTSIFAFQCPLLTDLILTDRKVDLTIRYSPLLVGAKIDALFTSLGTANTGATITLTTVQSLSGIDTTIATLKGWTIVII